MSHKGTEPSHKGTEEDRVLGSMNAGLKSVRCALCDRKVFYGKGD
jgi:hypothetical protein